MKRFLRYIACMAVLLLLIVCPVKAHAAEITLPDGTALGPQSNGGSTTFKVGEMEKWCYLTVTVRDGETNVPLQGVTVRVRPSIPTIDPDAGEAQLVTGPDGSVRFKRSKDPVIGYYIAIEHEGFHPYQSGAIIYLTTKEHEETVSLAPVYFTVRYHASWPGSIPPGEETESVRWGSPPKNPPTQMVEPGLHYVLTNWLLDGNAVDISQMKVKEDLDLYAQFSRQYLVRYEAGEYGYLDGPAEEFVTAGETPKAVPTPTPLTAREYWFVKWRLKWDSRSIDPATVVINKDTTFVAMFDVRKRQPVIVNTPSAKPDTAALDTAPTTAAVSPEEVSPAGGVHQKGSGGSRGGEQVIPSSSQPQSQEQTETPAAGQTNGEEPELPGDQSSVPASGQVSPGTASTSWNWLILLCCLLTLIAGIWRLLAIGRLPKRPRDEDGETKPEGAGLKAVVTEAIVGIICAVLWGIFFVSTGPADLYALALWAVIIVVMAALLIRGEYRLWKAISSKDH